MVRFFKKLLKKLRKERNRPPRSLGGKNSLPTSEGVNSKNLKETIKQGEANAKKSHAQKVENTKGKAGMKPKPEFDKKGWEKGQQEMQKRIDQKINPPVRSESKPTTPSLPESSPKTVKTDKSTKKIPRSFSRIRSASPKPKSATPPKKGPGIGK